MHICTYLHTHINIHTPYKHMHANVHAHTHKHTTYLDNITIMKMNDFSSFRLVSENSQL